MTLQLLVLTIIIGSSVGTVALWALACLNDRRNAKRAAAANSFEGKRRQVDEVFKTANIRMEEAAGRRQPGEYRVSDSLTRTHFW